MFVCSDILLTHLLFLKIELQLNQRIQNQEQTIEQLTTQLNETIEQRKEIDEMISQFSDQSIDHDTNEG
jgi:Tfp pilus assembly protein PilN